MSRPGETCGNKDVFFMLFSSDSKDRLSLNFHRFVILYRSCDTRSVSLGKYCLPKGSNGFKELRFEFKTLFIENTADYGPSVRVFSCLWLCICVFLYPYQVTWSHVNICRAIGRNKQVMPFKREQHFLGKMFLLNKCLCMNCHYKN